MARIALSVLALAASGTLAAAEHCAVPEARLGGAWQRVGDAGFFEEMVFSIDERGHLFSSWLHQRPELIDAAWRMKDCRLEIEPRADAFQPFEYRIDIVDGRLHLRDVAASTTGVYSRIEE